MVKYVKCPRCELNYIDPDKQEFCDVCIAEIQGNKLQFADLEDEELESEFDEEQTEICPVCGINRMRYGDTMCEACRRNSEYEEEEEDVDPDKDEEWKNYLDDAEDLSLEDAELDEELKEELEEDDEEEEDEESEESADDEDDFFEDVDSLDDLGDDDEDEDDFDDDDDDFDDDDDDKDDPF